VTGHHPGRDGRSTYRDQPGIPATQ